jgi:hypothetical protein
MQKLSMVFAGLALSGAMLASAAHAVTVVPFANGPFSIPADSAGIIPAGTFVAGGQTDDYTFTTLGGTYEALMQMQATTVKTGVPQNVSFTFFKGLPGSGVFIANSGGTATAATLLTLVNGTYYVEYTESGTQKALVTGGVTLLSTVPEPAAWTLMLLGVAGLGGLLRSRRTAVRAAI